MRVKKEAAAGPSKAPRRIIWYAVFCPDYEAALMEVTWIWAASYQ